MHSSSRISSNRLKPARSVVRNPADTISGSELFKNTIGGSKRQNLRTAGRISYGARNSAYFILKGIQARSRGAAELLGLTSNAQAGR